MVSRLLSTRTLHSVPRMCVTPRSPEEEHDDDDQGAGYAWRAAMVVFRCGNGRLGRSRRVGNRTVIEYGRLASKKRINVDEARREFVLDDVAGIYCYFSRVHLRSLSTRCDPVRLLERVETYSINSRAIEEYENEVLENAK